MAFALCPDCARQIDVGARPLVGQRVVCPTCEVELEIINLDPLEVDWAYNEPAEDWTEVEFGGRWLGIRRYF